MWSAASRSPALPSTPPTSRQSHRSRCPTPWRRRFRRSEAAGRRMERPEMTDNAPSADFSDEQKRYLEGFTSGLNVGRAAHQLSAARVPAALPKANPEPIGPDAAHIKAQD